MKGTPKAEKLPISYSPVFSINLTVQNDTDFQTIWLFLIYCNSLSLAFDHTWNVNPRTVVRNVSSHPIDVTLHPSLSPQGVAPLSRLTVGVQSF